MPTDDRPIVHLPFDTDTQDQGASSLATRATDVVLAQVGGNGQSRRAAVFNGRSSVIEVAPPGAIGSQPFTLTLWLHTLADEGDIVGDLVSQFDPDRRRGWTLSVVSNSGVTRAPLVNDRQLHFGIDDAPVDDAWHDHGRLGRAAKVSAMHVSNSDLFAGTFEHEADGAGHLWRYEGEGTWQDLGACPDGSNCLPAIARFSGALYCSTGRYNSQGSAMGPPRNNRPGGRVYRIAADGRWIDCGVVGAHGARPESEHVEGYFTDKADDTTSLLPFKGRLYAVSHHRKGVWEYDGNRDWKFIGPDTRLFSLTNFGGSMHALANGGPVLRYHGDGQWEDLGKPRTSTQTYGGAIYRGELYVSTWPDCDVYRYAGGQTWDLVSRVGFEREAMGMVVYNGKLYVGTLPMANVFRMDGGGFTFIGNLDASSAVLRRVWNLAVYRGRLFGGTLPSGHVLSLQAGAMATTDRAMPAGWRHIAAVRDHDRLRVYIDGALAASSTRFNASDYDLSLDQPIRLGMGQHAALDGALSDVALWNSALSSETIATMARE